MSLSLERIKIGRYFLAEEILLEKALEKKHKAIFSKCLKEDDSFIEFLNERTDKIMIKDITNTGAMDTYKFLNMRNNLGKVYHMKDKTFDDYFIIVFSNNGLKNRCYAIFNDKRSYYKFKQDIKPKWAETKNQVVRFNKHGSGMFNSIEDLECSLEESEAHKHVTVEPTTLEDYDY